MSRRLLFAVVTLVPTTVDVGLLVLLHQRADVALVVADLTAIAVASVVSFALHRVSTLRSSPYYRWVRDPLGFALIACVAAAVDASILVVVDAAMGSEAAGALAVSKTVAIAGAVVVRAIGFRYVLHPLVVASRSPVPRPPAEGSVRFSVVVPAYPAEAVIAGTIRRIVEDLHDIVSDGGVEVVVVDDGSDDDTTAIALASGATQVITLPANAGKGAAVRAGMRATHGRVVAFTDADLAYDPDHLRRLLVEIEGGWDVAIGNRRDPGSTVVRSSGIRAFGSRVINRLSAVVLLAAPLDTQCGLKAFRGDVARELFAHTRVDGFAFDIEVLHLVERASLSLTEIAVHLDEADTSSTVRLVGDVARLARDLVRVRRWSAVGRYDGFVPFAAAPARSA